MMHAFIPTILRHGGKQTVPAGRPAYESNREGRLAIELDRYLVVGGCSTCPPAPAPRSPLERWPRARTRGHSSMIVSSTRIAEGSHHGAAPGRGDLITSFAFAT
jgi:hypothetical protein